MQTSKVESRTLQRKKTELKKKTVKEAQLRDFGNCNSLGRAVFDGFTQRKSHLEDDLH